MTRIVATEEGSRTGSILPGRDDQREAPGVPTSSNPSNSPSDKELRELLGKAAEGPWFIRPRPTDEGLLVIEDGRDRGMFPVTGEAHEIRAIVAAVNALPSLLDRAEADRAEIARLRRTLGYLIGSVLAARTRNTPEYMAGLCEDINAAAEAIGDRDRAEFNGDGFRIIRQAKGSQQ